ncbi:MAG: hypothetical protein JSV91_00030 [Phycisphaerales bacterium]|nr:MAG: hypothetical protein JSV91_00030 [Phycisphaerales bacterium]
MVRHLAAGAAVLGVASFAGAVTTVYDNEADFLAAIGDYLLEDFDQYTYGEYTEYTLDIGPMNGYAGTISAEGGANSYLWSGYGDMSTNSALDWLRVDFTGLPTYSTGGFFYASDIGGYFVPGRQVVIELSNGFIYDFVPASQTDFRGFLSTDELFWMTIDAPDDASYYWSSMDHFYIDSPAPGALALLGLAGLMRRRRR